MGKPRVQLDKSEFIYMYLHDKASGLELARHFGIGRTTVSRYIKEFELAPRTIAQVRANKHWGPSQEQRDKLRALAKSQKGINNPHWKGGFFPAIGMTKGQYQALHEWVIRQLGRPRRCEGCGKGGLKGHQIHWANKSGQYKKDLDDWARLCVKCHRKHDESLTYGQLPDNS